MSAAESRPKAETGGASEQVEEMSETAIQATVEGGVAAVAGAAYVHIENLTQYAAAPAPAPHFAGPVPPCPYPGLAYFGPQDSTRFFGREEAIKALERAVARRSFTALVGASGSGKSSVVLAGLAPRLDARGGWRSSYFRVATEPDKNPFAALARALAPLVGEGDVVDHMARAQKLAAAFTSGDIALATVIAQCRAANPGKRILLIADQFEEVFTLVGDETLRNRFIDTLIAAFPDPADGAAPDVCLMLTLRADFYNAALRHRPLADKLQDRVENLGPMTRDELREAIVNPAAAAEVEFEPGLVDSILDDVEKRPGSLPLLQFALREMWGRLEEPLMTRTEYEAIGGVEGALAKRAQAIFDGATQQGKDETTVALFRRLFTRLVAFGEGAEDTRRIVGRVELGPEAWDLAQKLAGEDNRLVVTAAPLPGQETAEVMHEALIRNWPALVEWVNRDRAFQSWLRQLKQRLDEWRANPADDGTLLRGGPLVVAEEWVAKRGGEVNKEEKAFVAASVALRDSERRRAEEESQREQTRQNEIADAKARTAQAQRLERRLKIGALAAVVVALGVVGFLSWYAVQKERAKDARLALVADLNKEIINEPDLSVLIQACARSHWEDPAVGPECAASAESLSQDIVITEGLEQSVSRQSELHAYVRNKLGKIVELGRVDGAYRALLDDGKYFIANFERPVIPSAADLKTLPPCGRSTGIKSLTAAKAQDAFDLCPSSDILRNLDFRPPAVAAVDDSRHYAVVTRCAPEGCATTLVGLDGQNEDPITVHHDIEPVSPGGSVSRTTASANTLVYALCEQDSGPNCRLTVRVYRLSNDRRTAHQIGVLPGSFDFITMAASEDSVAVAYRAIGGSIKVKVFPTAFVKPDPPWLPDGSRVFDVPFSNISSLIFDEKGKYLVAAADEGYLIHWKTDGQLFVENPWPVEKLGERQFAQYMTVSGSGRTVVTGLALVGARSEDRGCLRIGEIGDEGVTGIANSTRCADAGALQDRLPTGWNVVATDHEGAILVATGGFSKGIILRRYGNIFERQPADFPPDVSVASVSADGKLIVAGDRGEGISTLEETNGVFKSTPIAAIDTSCVRFSGVQRRVSAISFFGNDNTKFLVATQEGCLAFFVKGVSGWRPQVLIDAQMPDVVAASVSPDSRWAVLGTTSGRIQIWDLLDLKRPPATVDARLPWLSTFAWLSPGKSTVGQWMIMGNSRFGPIGSWLIQDNGDSQQPPTVSAIFPPSWVDMRGVVGVSAVKGSLLAATTDGRLLRLRNVETPEAILGSLIDRACEISGPLVRDAAYPPPTAHTDDDEFISLIMNWARKRCPPTDQSSDNRAKR
jgi:WD40 repeat protein